MDFITYIVFELYINLLYSKDTKKRYRQKTRRKCYGKVV